MTERNDADLAARAKQRASWPVRIGKLDAPPTDDLSATTTAAERIGMVWPLTLEAWAFAGLSIPDYRGEDTPVVMNLPGDSKSVRVA